MGMGVYISVGGWAHNAQNGGRYGGHHHRSTEMRASQLQLQGAARNEILQRLLQERAGD